MSLPLVLLLACVAAADDNASTKDGWGLEGNFNLRPRHGSGKPSAPNQLGSVPIPIPVAPAPPAERVKVARIDEAIALGAKFLAGRQLKDGSWNVGDASPSAGWDNLYIRTGVTAYATKAFDVLRPAVRSAWASSP